MVHAADKYIQQFAGQTNSYYVSGATTSSAITGSTTNTLSRIVFLTAGNLTSVTSTSITGSTNISSGTTIAAGTVIAGKITKIKTKAGSFLCYNWT